jgi:hypothetical protein
MANRLANRKVGEKHRLPSNDNVTAYNGMNCTVKDLAGWANENG